MGYDAELTAFIRDIAIIVSAIMVTAAAVTFMVVLLRLYRPAQRSVRNFELASRLTLEAAARVSGIVSLGSEFASLIWGLVERVRGRFGGGPPEDDGDGAGDGGSSPSERSSPGGGPAARR